MKHSGTFQINRTGTFTVPIREGSPHCGILEGKNTFKYEVSCSVSIVALDEQGFVMDNADIQTYFDRAFREPLGISCERVALKAAKDIYAMLGERSQFCEGVSVKIWGRTDSYIEFKWTKEAA